MPSSSRRGRVCLLHPAPECRDTAFLRAARLALDLSARVSGSRGRLLRGVWGLSVCSLFLLGRPHLRAGRCLFLETLFCHSGSPASQSNSWPPPPEPAPRLPGVAGPAHPCPLPAAPAFPGRFLPAGRASVRSWRGGPAPARKLESFVLVPRPAREEGGIGGRAGEASGGPGPGLGLLSAFPPGLGLLGLLGLRAPGGAQNWSCLAPYGPELLLRSHLCGSWAGCTPWAWRGSTTGPRAGPHGTPPPSQASLSLPLREMGER